MTVALIWILGFVAGCQDQPVAGRDQMVGGRNPMVGNRNPSLNLVTQGVSNYTIVLPDDPLPADKQGAVILQKYLSRVSGATLPISGESDFKKGVAAGANGVAPGPDNPSGKGMAIYLGRTNASEAVYDFSRIRDDGFFIATGKTALFIAGAHGKGTVYGVYDFLDRYLGCKKYSSEPAYVPHAPTIQVDEGLYDLRNPALRYRQSYYPMSHDPEYLEWHHLQQFEDLWGVWGHSYFKIIPPKDYYATHPEYFALVNGKRQPTQLCLSNENVFRLTVEYLRKRMAENPDALYWSVSANDDNGYCTCDLCRKADAEEGGPQGSLIRFVNRVAVLFPDKIITTLAYGYTSRPPQKTRPAANVYVMLSSIDAMRNQPLEQASGAAAFRANLSGWAAITPRLMVWDYTTQFTNYLAPFPDYQNLRPNLRYLRAHAVQGVFEQGSGDTYGDMAEYNSYLQAALLWNPEADADSLTAGFCNGFYGNAGRFLLSYLQTMGAAVRSAGKPLDIYGNPINEYNGFLTPEAIDHYSSLLDQAEAAVETQPVFLARVRSARLPLEYTVLQQSRFYGIEPHGYLLPSVDGQVSSIGSASADGHVSSGAHGGYVVNAAWPRRVERFVTACRQNGVTELSEGGLSPEAYGAEWKAIFANGWEKNNALQAKVTLDHPYAEDYPAKGNRTLTDGVPGYNDFSYNWLCFYGVDMICTLDLGSAQTVNRVHLHFLDDPRHWIFLPESVRVEVSSDGISYAPLGSYTCPAPQEDYAVTIDERLFKAPRPLQARFIRVTAVAPPTLPAWRYSETKKPMICSDEIYVQ
jgi:hypothetical protein